MFCTVFTISAFSGCLTVFAPCYETVSLWLDSKAISSLSSPIEYATVNICVLVAFPPCSCDDE